MFLKPFFGLLATMFVALNVAAQTAPPVTAGVSHELAQWRAAHYSDVRYKLSLTLEKMSPTLKGSIEISVNVKNADAIILDWRKIAGKETASQISSVSLNDTAAKFAELNEHLVFKENIKAGENIIKLDFTSPIATSGAAVTRYVDKEDGAEYIYSLFVPSDASTAFPCFDQPDLKARFSFKIRTPYEWRTISNTNSEICYAMDPGAPATCIFEETKPISTYVFAFAAGDFAEFADNGSVPGAVATGLDSTKRKMKANPPATAGGTDPQMTASGKIYVRKSQAEKFKPHAAEVFRLNREAVKYLAGYFDYKFPFPKYDLVLLPEFPFGGMEHAGATFLRESSVIFPTTPTANDYISRGNLIFHEAAHQWFGDTVTMRWFDDLWLKEGFAEFMAYKTMEKVLPQYNAWKAFYERNKPLAYQTDSTRGTTAIYQDIPNLSAAKSAYGNIVYRKAPAFLRQAEFYLGADKFQTAVRAFLKQNAFKNAEWQDLVKSFETASGQDLKDWADIWVKKRGLPKVTAEVENAAFKGKDKATLVSFFQSSDLSDYWIMNTKSLVEFADGKRQETKIQFTKSDKLKDGETQQVPCCYPALNLANSKTVNFVFPNYQDYGYGIFLLDERSRSYILANIQTEKDEFLRAMMWGALWDSVREAELDPRDYVELAIKNIGTERDELTIQTILARTATALNYYLSEPPASAGGSDAAESNKLKAASDKCRNKILTFVQRASFITCHSSLLPNPPADAGGSDLSRRFEAVLIDKMRNSQTLGQRVTFYRAFLNVAATDAGRRILKDILNSKLQIADFKLRTKDKFDIVTRLLILNDADAPQMLRDLEKTETSDDAKRFAYAARAAVATMENKAAFYRDFVGNNRDVSESWIETALAPFNSIRRADLTLPYLEKALAELPNLKRSRKIFFVNGWLAAFVGGQKSEPALRIVNKFLADNPNLDKDLQLKILENVDVIERAVKIRSKFPQ